MHDRLVVSSPCGQAVASTGQSLCTITLFSTQAVLINSSTSAQPAGLAHFVQVFYTALSHAFYNVYYLLQGQLSTLSTVPTITTTSTLYNY